MAYKKDIPQPTDKLRNSQSELRNNFQAIDEWVQQDHVGLTGNGDEGKHNKTTYIDQSSAPSLDSGEVGIFNAVPDTIGSVSGLDSNELHVRKSGGSEIPFTARGNGWTYLPSGLIIKFGEKKVTGRERIDFPSGSGIPSFSGGSPRVTLSVEGTTGEDPVAVTREGGSTSSITVRVFKTTNGNDAEGKVYYIAIGR